MRLRRDLILFINISVFILLLSIPFAVTQTYDLDIVIVNPNEYKTYQVTYNDAELGDGWNNHLECTIGTNETIEVYWITADGYIEFLENENLDDIAQANILEEVHFSDGLYFERTVWTQNIKTIYTILNNTSNNGASWSIILHPLSDYNDPSPRFIPGYSIFVIMFVILTSAGIGLRKLYHSNK